jgi:hypothetical protein
MGKSLGSGNYGKKAKSYSGKKTGGYKSGANYRTSGERNAVIPVTSSSNPGQPQPAGVAQSQTPPAVQEVNPKITPAQVEVETKALPARTNPQGPAR